MAFSLRRTATLVCHPDTPNAAVRGMQAELTFNGESLTLNYSVTGDLARLRIPPPQPPRRADRLWQHSCFEAFVAAQGEPGYREFNFAPSGEWAAYAFRGYREDMQPFALAQAPAIRLRKTADRLELSAALRLGDLPQGRELKFALCAVIEDLSGALSYWALCHPAGKPDFHRPDAFALELALDAA